MTVSYRPLVPATDAETCDAIILSLPEWFGHEGGRADCAQSVRTQAGWVAEQDGQVIGFAVWTERTPETAEITWAAVHRDHRNGGTGTGIVERLVADLQARGYRLALVMTSARSKTPDSGPDSYAETRAFWRARGLLPLIELDIWDTDVALLSVRPLTP